MAKVLRTEVKLKLQEQEQSKILSCFVHRQDSIETLHSGPKYEFYGQNENLEIKTEPKV